MQITHKNVLRITASLRELFYAPFMDAAHGVIDRDPFC